jgi:hypothetical protein
MVGTSFQDNQVVIDWVNNQPLANTVTCVGDGHDGIWNIVDQLAPDVQRREVLDWFHLIENLHKVGGSLKRLKQAQSLLWKGQVDATISILPIVKVNRHKTFAIIWINIAMGVAPPSAIALSIMNTIKLKKFVRLALALLNLPLNRLTVALRFPERNGSEKMYLKSWPIAVPISMDYCRFEPLQKLRCSPDRIRYFLRTNASYFLNPCRTRVLASKHCCW